MKTTEEGALAYLSRRRTDPRQFAKDYRNASIFLVLDGDERTYLPLAWALTAREKGWESKTRSMNSGNARRIAQSQGLEPVEHRHPLHMDFWNETLDEVQQLTDEHLRSDQQGFSVRNGAARQPKHNSYYVLRQTDHVLEAAEMVMSPEEASSEPGFEGALRQVTTNRYERDPKLRRACIDFYKNKDKGQLKCQVCGRDFSRYYGAIGLGFIHVHHKNPLGERQQAHSVDPQKDLVPVCPNCHAMLHKKPGAGAYSLDELREMIAQNGQ